MMYKRRTKSTIVDPRARPCICVTKFGCRAVVDLYWTPHRLFTIIESRTKVGISIWATDAPPVQIAMNGQNVDRETLSGLPAVQT
jgi:hypothetical protein